MIYFTSDLHFGHKNIIRLCNRPFDMDVERMNRELIANINAVVGPEDELWILGDFSHCIGMDRARAFRKEIRCRNVHLVCGNHDLDYAGQDVFQSVQTYKELQTAYGRVVLFHYPILEWNGCYGGSIHLHGHIHSHPDYNARCREQKLADRLSSGIALKDADMRLRIYDVGVDANNYRPISLDEIANYLGVGKK